MKLLIQALGNGPFPTPSPFLFAVYISVDRDDIDKD